MYWAGPRCFMSTMRHFDLETIRVLEDDYEWIVHYPTRIVSENARKHPDLPMLGKNGIIRTSCFEYIDKSDIVVAYTGLIWDTGTAREVEYGITKNKAILAWSDSSVIFGETSGRNIALNGNDFEKLYVSAMPFNAMDLVFDRYLEVSALYNDGIKEQDLAKTIDRECRKVLNANDKKL